MDTMHGMELGTRGARGARGDAGPPPCPVPGLGAQHHAASGRGSCRELRRGHGAEETGSSGSSGAALTALGNDRITNGYLIISATLSLMALRGRELR